MPRCALVVWRDTVSLRASACIVNSFKGGRGACRAEKQQELTPGDGPAGASLSLNGTGIGQPLLNYGRYDLALIMVGEMKSERVAAFLRRVISFFALDP
jgi:hypothetical protein